MKRTISMLLVGAMCMALLGGCGKKEENSSAPSPEPEAVESNEETQAPAEGEGEETAQTGEKRRVFFTNAFYTAPFCAFENEQAMKTAEENNIELTLVDGEGNNELQYEQIQQAIEEGYDGIIYFPADTAGTVSIVNLLNDSGVPYIVIDSQVDESVVDTITAFVGPNNVTMGEVCGQAAVDVLEGSGNVCMLNGAPGADPAIKRDQGFRNIVEKEDGIKILDAQWVDGWDTAKAMSIMQDYITTYGDQIDLVFCGDDGIYQGAWQAIEAAGYDDKILCVATGANTYACQMMREGKLYGDVLHSAKEEGATGIRTIIDVMDGKIKPGDSVWVELSSPFVNADNVDEWEGKGW